jgi:uncharacterized membrane protein YphA (DoxX/SURF4 family)
MNKDFCRNNDLGLLVLRVSLGGLMLFHGIHKLVFGVGFIGVKSLMDTNPKSADEVSTLKGLSSHYQDAWAQVNEALKDLPEE